MKSIYVSPNGTTTGLVDPNGRYYVVQLIGKVSQKFYQKVFQEILLEAKKNPYPALLINIKDLEHNPDPGRQWLNTYFFRRFYKLNQGFKLAIVQPRAKVAQVSVGLFYNLIETLGIKISLKYFDDVPAAQAWLQESETKKSFNPIQMLRGKGGDHQDQVIERAQELKLSRNKLRLKVQFSPSGNFKSDTTLNPIAPFKNIGLQKIGELGKSLFPKSSRSDSKK